MGLSKTVPKFRGKGVHVWLGLALLVLFSIQALSGFSMIGGNRVLKGPHFLNAMLMLGLLSVHAYFGIGLSFFGFKLKR